MPSDEPFKALARGLQVKKPIPKPPTADEIRDRILNNQAGLIDSINRFSNILSEKNASVTFNTTRVDTRDGILYADIKIRSDNIDLGLLPLKFQGEMFWVMDSDFVKLANRENRKGSWATDELDDFNEHLGRHILGLIKR